MATLSLRQQLFMELLPYYENRIKFVEVEVRIRRILHKYGFTNHADIEKVIRCLKRRILPFPDRQIMAYEHDVEPFIGAHDPTWEVLHNRVLQRVMSSFPPKTKLNIIFFQSGAAWTELHLMLSMIPKYSIGHVYMMDVLYGKEEVEKNISNLVERFSRSRIDVDAYQNLGPMIQHYKTSVSSMRSLLEKFLRRLQSKNVIEGFKTFHNYDELIDSMGPTPDKLPIHMILSIHPNVTNHADIFRLENMYRDQFSYHFPRTKKPDILFYTANNPWLLIQGALDSTRDEKIERKDLKSEQSQDTEFYRSLGYNIRRSDIYGFSKIVELSKLYKIRNDQRRRG